MKKFDNIEGFPGYFISKSGKCYSRKNGVWRRLTGNTVKQKGKAYTVKQYFLFYPKGSGFSKRGKFGRASRLVAQAWVPNPNPKEYDTVCHKDNNPMNNHYTNLYWGTQSMNIQRAVRENRFPQCRRYGKDNPMYGRKPWNTGKQLSKEIRDKISKANKGRKLSDQAKANISKGILSKGPSKITHRKLRRIFRLRSKGLPQMYISKRTHLHQTMVSKILNKQCKFQKSNY